MLTRSRTPLPAGILVGESIRRRVPARSRSINGANRLDGRERSGAVVTDGLYLVTVEALGQMRSQTLAVVR